MPMGLCSSPVSAPAAAGTRDRELGRLTQQRSFLCSLGGWTSKVMDVQGQGVQLTLRSKQSSAAHRAAPASEGPGLPLAAGAPPRCRRSELPAKRGGRSRWPFRGFTPALQFPLAAPWGRRPFLPRSWPGAWTFRVLAGRVADVGGKAARRPDV